MCNYSVIMRMFGEKRREIEQNKIQKRKKKKRAVEREIDGVRKRKRERWSAKGGRKRRIKFV